MKQISDIRKQLIKLCQKLEINPNASCSLISEWENILKCFLTGFFMNVAVLQHDGSYKTLVSNQVVYIHPSSVLFGRKPEAVFFTELVQTSKKYMRKISSIQMSWLVEVAPHYYGKSE
jgi:HrpA-like RNA helicase